MRALAHLNQYLWQYKWHIVLGTLFIVLSNLFGIYAPVLIREAFNLIEETISAYQGDSISNYTIQLPESVVIINDLFGLDADKFTNINDKSSLADLITRLSLILAAIYLGVSLLKGVFLFFTRQTIIVMSRLIEFDLKNEVFDHYQKLTLAFYRRNNTGDLMNRISEDVSQVRMYLGPAIMYSTNLVI